MVDWPWGEQDAVTIRYGCLGRRRIVVDEKSQFKLPPGGLSLGAVWGLLGPSAIANVTLGTFLGLTTLAYLQLYH